MITVFLALGSNLGDRAAALRGALAALPPDVRVTRPSPVYETAPQYVTDQPAFLNMAAAVETALPPEALIARLKAIETALGRQPSVRFGPRLIDLDILYYGDRLLATAPLEIPHPRLAERSFVLEPLADIAADWRDPRDGRSVREMRDNLRAATGGNSDVRRLSESLEEL